jgi:phosphatidylserine/phosphatidylglycerophosphate/cardiolipin synthase-like enzyme
MRTDTTTSILAEGESCWRIAEADRFSVIVDASGFFRLAREAMLKAKHSIMLIGWDFDTRIRLTPDQPKGERPDKLGRFLEDLARQTPGLQIRILKWDYGLLSSITRGETPLHMLRWMVSRQIHLKLDRAHPPLAAHHMKLLVIDDAVAFCGGIDMTVGRWDTRDHLEDDPNRLSPFGRPEPPWHDATTCASGPAARALGDLARDRWEMATGERLDPIAPAGPSADPWPAALVPEFRNVRIGIARTSPQYKARREVVEIETATLAMIASARKSLYIESQYFANRRLAEAMAKRLTEPDGPEIVIVNPKSASGWLEEKTMDTARARLVRMIQEADPHDRFRIVYPVNAAGTAIYVHAKIMIVDDRILKLGSANLNNRSMGYDTESDVILEVSDEDTELRAAIRARRDDLLAEHLGRSVEAVTEAMAAAGGSLIQTIDRLGRADGRGLKAVGQREMGPDDELVAESDLVDPERPAGVRYRTSQFLRNRFGRRLFTAKQG